LEQVRAEAIPTPEEKVSKIQRLEIEPQIELVGEDNRTAGPKVNIEPLVPIQVEIIEL
jgi:hypothetical protein